MAASIKDWVLDFIQFGRNEKNWSEETLRAYESDLGQFETFLEAEFKLEVFPCADSTCPSLDDGLQVIRMRHWSPATIFRLRQRKAGVIEPSFVVIVPMSIRTRGPDDLRHGISQEAVSFRSFAQSGGDLCFLQIVLYPKLFRDVTVDTDDVQMLTAVIHYGHLRA